jgi:hypothetical protein
MDLFIAGRVALDDAADLITRFGDQAVSEAAALAKQSRNDGNLLSFCHWRQIERVIAALAHDRAEGTVH